MANAEQSRRLVRFGVFEADLRTGELRKSGLKRMRSARAGDGRRDGPEWREGARIQNRITAQRADATRTKKAAKKQLKKLPKEANKSFRLNADPSE